MEEVGELPDSQFERFREVIVGISQDGRFLRRIRKLYHNKRHATIMSWVARGELERKVIHPIDDEQYSTLAACCKNVIDSVE